MYSNLSPTTKNCAQPARSTDRTANATRRRCCTSSSRELFCIWCTLHARNTAVFFFAAHTRLLLLGARMCDVSPPANGRLITFFFFPHVSKNAPPHSACKSCFGDAGRGILEALLLLLLFGLARAGIEVSAKKIAMSSAPKRRRRRRERCIWRRRGATMAGAVHFRGDIARG